VYDIRYQKQTNFWFEAYVYNDRSFEMNTINNDIVLTVKAAAYKAAALTVDIEECFNEHDPEWGQEQFVAAQAAAERVLAKAAPNGVTIYSGRCKWSPVFNKALIAAEKAVDRLREPEVD